MTTVVVVGDPKAGILHALHAARVARELSGRDADLVVDLATLGSSLLSWDDPEVAALVEQVRAADLVVFACPT